MLFSIENARYSLPKFWLILACGNVIDIALFLFPLFSGDLSTHFIFVLMGTAACIGLVIGAYLTFRSDFGTAFAFFRFLYALLMMEFIAAGGASALALWVAGRRDLCWPAFYANGLVMLVSMLFGAYCEARTLELWGTDTRNRWRSKLNKYIDYSRHQVNPSLTASSLSIGKENENSKYPIWIIAAGTANICLLFELYGGGRNNAAFIVAPILTGVFAYINLQHSGPGLVRLLLLRKLEKESGRKFVNADLEQIQELRRTFFLSRWLMKDYAPPNPAPTAQKREARQRKRK